MHEYFVFVANKCKPMIKKIELKSFFLLLTIS